MKLDKRILLAVIEKEKKHTFVEKYWIESSIDRKRNYT